MANTTTPYTPVLTVIETGIVMEYTNAGTVELSPGDPVPMAACFGVAIPSGGVSGQSGSAVASGIAVGGTGPVVVRGVVQGPALSTDVWAQGEATYWNATDGAFTVESSGGTPAGYAWAAKAAGVTTGEVKLPY